MDLPLGHQWSDEQKGGDTSKDLRMRAAPPLLNQHHKCLLHSKAGTVSFTNELLVSTVCHGRWKITLISEYTLYVMGQYLRSQMAKSYLIQIKACILCLHQSLKSCIPRIINWYAQPLLVTVFVIFLTYIFLWHHFLMPRRHGSMRLHIQELSSVFASTAVCDGWSSQTGYKPLEASTHLPVVAAMDRKGKLWVRRNSQVLTCNSTFLSCCLHYTHVEKHVWK